MSAADSIRDFVAPLLPGWRLQFGRWTDGNKAHRYMVIKPAGGLPADLLRRPEFTLTLIGAEGEGTEVPFDAADVVIEAMRESSGSLVFMHPSEPSSFQTTDGRPVAEFAVSTIVE